MSKSHLFSPINVGGLELANRIVIAPMCQYSAEDGRMTDWHVMHLGQLSHSGAGMLTIEATAVEPVGRITAGDVGLWDDATEAAIATVVASIRQWSSMPLSIQLGHAGRKASCELPWLGGAQLAPDHDRGWQTVGPSTVPFSSKDNPPAALDEAGLERIKNAFAQAAIRSARLGFDAIQ
ncbi:MAG: oxidoreductase, partial [Aliihoeflea sp.]